MVRIGVIHYWLNGVTRFGILPWKTTLREKSSVMLTWMKTLMVVLLICVTFHFFTYQRYEPKTRITVSVPETYISCLNRSRHRNISQKWSSDIPLLTLFTTWPDDASISSERENTLHNWSRLKPWVQPVFFSDSDEKSTYILEQGWKIVPISKASTSGVPVLKHMFMDAICNFDSVFYGFSNGDILYDDSLIDSLKVVSEATDRHTPLLVTGIRTNVFNVTSSEVNIVPLKTIAEKRGKLFITDAEDYFITDASFPWETIPEVVIGRPGYDNWVILHARQINCTVIDATETLLAVHQTATAGNFQGHDHADSHYNIEMLKLSYNYVPYEEGFTVCASWMTRRQDSTGDMHLIQRNILPVNCNYHLPIILYPVFVIFLLFSGKSLLSKFKNVAKSVSMR